MSKDFNSDMFSAILKANETSMALLEKQLGEAQKQAKRKDIIYCVVIACLSLLLGGMIYVYYNNKPVMNVDYGQGVTDSSVANSTFDYNNNVGE